MYIVDYLKSQILLNIIQNYLHFYMMKKTLERLIKKNYEKLINNKLKMI